MAAIEVHDIRDWLRMQQVLLGEPNDIFAKRVGLSVAGWKKLKTKRADISIPTARKVYRAWPQHRAEICALTLGNNAA